MGGGWERGRKLRWRGKWETEENTDEKITVHGLWPSTVTGLCRSPQPRKHRCYVHRMALFVEHFLIVRFLWSLASSRFRHYSVGIS